MSNDVAHTSLREPEQVDWDNMGKSSYTPPPPAVGPDGQHIVYFGQVAELKKDTPDEGYLNYVLDAKIVRAGAPVDGTRIRIWASTRPFQRRGLNGGLEPVKGNPNKLAQFLKACGLSAKPQTNAEYEAALKAVANKPFPFTLDWAAKNKETGEVVKGYLNFPEDPERPGQRKSILRAGDVVTERDNKGNITGTRTIQSEILFANPQFKYFKDSAPKVTK